MVSLWLNFRWWNLGNSFSSFILRCHKLLIVKIGPVEANICIYLKMAVQWRSDVEKGWDKTQNLAYHPLKHWPYFIPAYRNSQICWGVNILGDGKTQDFLSVMIGIQMSQGSKWLQIILDTKNQNDTKWAQGSAGRHVCSLRAIHHPKNQASWLILSRVTSHHNPSDVSMYVVLKTLQTNTA